MSIVSRIFGIPKRHDTSVTFAVDPVTLSASQRVERSGHCACLALRTKKGTPSVPNLHDEMQDNSKPGWQAMLNLVAANRSATMTVLEPSATIDADHWADVITLPSEIQTLTVLKQLRLYGSHLRRLPPELGRLAALEDLDIYTSYSLHWLPYEVIRCKHLSQTRISTRALYGNIKTRLPFPRLSGTLEALMPQTCSVCDETFGSRAAELFWTTQRIGTDVVPLLIHSCSPECVSCVPDAPDGYHARPHRGGGGVGMPDPDLD
jgi:hypothetical protein